MPKEGSMPNQGEENIFDKHASEEPTTAQEEQEQESKPDETSSTQKSSLPEGLEEWVGEGRKYRDVETALSSIPHAQEHINSLEQQLEEYKRKVEEAKTVDDLLEKMNQSGTGQGSETPSDNAPTTDDVMSLVNEAIEKREAQQTAEQNVKQVISTLSSHYGEKAKEQYQKRADELGMSTTDLDALCSKSPTAALSLLGVTSGKESSEASPSSGSLRSEGLAQTERAPERRSVMSAGDTKTVQNEWQRIKQEITKKYGG